MTRASAETKTTARVMRMGRRVIASRNPAPSVSPRAAPNPRRTTRATSCATTNAMTTERPRADGQVLPVHLGEHHDPFERGEPGSASPAVSSGRPAILKSVSMNPDDVDHCTRWAASASFGRWKQTNPSAYPSFNGLTSSSAVPVDSSIRCVWTLTTSLRAPRGSRQLARRDRASKADRGGRQPTGKPVVLSPMPMRPVHEPAGSGPAWSASGGARPSPQLGRSPQLG